MNYKTITLEENDGVFTLILNRPEKLNALNRTMCEEFLSAIQQLRNEKQAKVLIVAANGKCFSSGGDLSIMQEISGSVLKTDELLRQFPDIILGLRKLDIPVIAKIQGDAYGGGFCLALACDMRISVDTANFAFVFLRVGLSGADFGATYFLPRLVGIAKSFELLSLSKTIDAKEAHRLGLLNFITTKDKLDEETNKVVEQLKDAPPFALRMTKKALYFSLDRDIESEFNYECYVQDLCFQTEDHQEGVIAFLEKRKPEFKGR